ncbi:MULTISPECIES: 2-amino-4-oxopentanoate thiolase subunit OrtA [Fusobacterium]|uniref:2-amino-4-oxopentanoate thiolase subunit OrtA n=1 Tax=Fusobacterium TaxID=848 RepID=UPI0025C3211F|nr:2-amino-4-oxopentanoate thiolase subunit OrtA [Fusobacterium sp.]MCI5725854.1 2-amino-4-oxopentanoate thiolase subunit OrtA [Fusobacterium sp.]MDY5305481.1 2-amino-4-oxopentanoate thiolase subunit OrtA [Fusobacterium gastrosuis]
MEAKKGDFVRIYNIVLTAEQRAPQLPEDTKKVPLEMWVKGFLQSDANIGDEVEVLTITGRRIKGKLTEINPVYRHNYGEFIPELLQIGLQARAILFGGENND